MPAKGDAPTPQDEDGAVYTAAADRIRASAKWLVATFGAVGAVVFAGIALSDLGQVSDGRLFVVAVGCAVLAALGVIYAIVAAGNIVTQSYVTLSTIGDSDEDSDEDTDMLAGLSASEFHQAWAAARKESRTVQEQRNAAYISSTSGMPAELSRKLVAAEWQRSLLEALAKPFLAQKSFEHVRDAYVSARIKIGGGALVTFIGIIGFVATTQHVPPRLPVVGTVPVQVRVEIKKDARDRYQRVLGADCDVSALSGTAIGTHGDVVVVAVPSSGTCSEALLDLTPADAAVMASHS
ncbi:MAG: hypothetical protein JWR32_2641 [Mycobacterium sp.]|jgi:hypothetical protein|nr:hypothetical protein [Mycobacterium sp.]